MNYINPDMLIQNYQYLRDRNQLNQVNNNYGGNVNNNNFEHEVGLYTQVKNDERKEEKTVTNIEENNKNEQFQISIPVGDVTIKKCIIIIVVLLIIILFMWLKIVNLKHKLEIYQIIKASINKDVI